MNEIWKDIADYEGFYQVSNFGRVKSLSRYAKCRNGNRSVSENILKPQPNGAGYYTVTLCKNGTIVKHLLHRIIAIAFIPNPNNLPCINHKDANRKNNSITNLEWCTHKYNSNYHICKDKQSAFMINRYVTDESWKKSCAERLNKYTTQMRKKVCQLDVDNNVIHIWESTLEAEQLGGYIHGNISACANGKRKTHHGYKWVWLNELGGDYHNSSSNNQ